MVRIDSLRPADWASTCYIVKPDFKQLTSSVKTYGMLSPIIAQKDGTIIDGYHRWVIANENRIKNVPVVYVDVDKIEAILLHIDLNRYRGVVISKFLSRLIQRISASGRYSDEKLCTRMGMTWDEFDVLKDGSLVKMRKIKQHTYSPAWVPIESPTGEDIHIERPTGHKEQV